MADPLKLSGVILRTTDYGESDRVVVLFTAERGKVAAFARAARASKKRFGGGLEPFTEVKAEARERRGAELLTLESVSVVRAFGSIRGELARIACAGYACDLARSLVRDAEPHPELLALLLDYLSRLERHAADPTTLRAYELGALKAAGLMPSLIRCPRCGARLEEKGARVRFDPLAGGVLCPGCASTASAAAHNMAGATALALVRLQGGLDVGEAEPLPPAAGIEARDALTGFIEHHLGARLASRKFLDEVGPLLGAPLEAPLEG